MKLLRRLFQSTRSFPVASQSRPVRAATFEKLEGRALYSATVASTTTPPSLMVTSAVSTQATVDPFTTPLNFARATYKKGVAAVSGGYGVFDSGDYIRFDNVNFGSGSGARSALITMALPPGQEGGRVDLRINDVNTGPRIGIIFAQPTGSFTTYVTQRVYVSGAAGIKNLFIVARDKANVANIKSVQFSRTKINRVMALGDSITNGYGGSDNYRYFLNKSLLAAGRNVDFVGTRMTHANLPNVTGTTYPPKLDYDQQHEGYAGYSSAQILSLANNAARVNKPEIVLLHIGTNDAAAGTPASTTGSNIGGIIDALRAANPNVKIILAKILPRQGYTSQIDAINAQITSVAASKSVTLVDMNSGFSTTTHLSDGIHPNNTGANLMATRWKTAIDSVL